MSDKTLYHFAIESARSRVIWNKITSVRLQIIGSVPPKPSPELEVGELPIIFGAWRVIKCADGKKSIETDYIGLSTRKLYWRTNSVEGSLSLLRVKSCDAIFMPIHLIQKHGFIAVRNLVVTDSDNSRHLLPIKGASAVTFMLNCLVRISRKAQGIDVKM